MNPEELEALEDLLADTLTAAQRLEWLLAVLGNGPAQRPVRVEAVRGLLAELVAPPLQQAGHTARALLARRRMRRAPPS